MPMMNKRFIFACLGGCCFLSVYWHLIFTLSSTLSTQLAASTKSALRTTSANVNDELSTRKRGIIICLYDALVPMAVSLVHELRTLGNMNLVQMYHCNGELSPSSQRIITSMDANVHIIDGCAAMVAAGRLSASQVDDFRSFWLKALALVHTNLEEVIIVDADDLIFHDVALLWSVPGYEETGTLFFYDREIYGDGYLQANFTSDDNVVPGVKALIDTFNYAALNISKGPPSSHLMQSLAWSGDSDHEQDSSIVVVNKRKSPKAIEVLWKLVTDDRYRVRFTYGDKELFWLAFEIAHVPYAFSPWANSGAASPNDIRNHPDTACGGLAQFMPTLTNDSVLLHINSGRIFDPYTDHKIESLVDAGERMRELLANIPTYVSKRRTRSKALIKPNDPANPWPQECLYKRGSEPIRPEDIMSIQRRINNAMNVALIQKHERRRDGLSP